MERFLHAFIDFASLLLFPFIGVLALVKRRALGYLVAATLVWTLGGGLLLFQNWTFGLSRPRLEHAWLVGIALAAAFLAIAWLKEKRKVSRWLKLTMAAVTLVVFLRALWQFFDHYT
ncbi:MAG: hypothetical protein K8S98_08490 [Planctomycetes bacterium]|nr:hypothetical protein [Planctomycetota bacterium]